MSKINVNPIIFTGRPDSGNRFPKELRVYDLLDSLGVEYFRLDHQPVETIRECADIDSLLNIDICKNLFLCNAQKTAFYLLLLPGSKKFNTSRVSKQIGSSRLSFADAAHMEQFLDITPGSVSVLGLMNDKEHHVQLLIDKDILQYKWFGCHPCVNTTSLKFLTSDLTEKILPAIGVDFIEIEL